MKTLQTIQKTFHVFQILTKIAFVFCIVGASLCALGALCATVWYTGGRVFSLFGEEILFDRGTAGLMETMATLLANMIYLSADAVLLGLAGRYFKIEQAEGTPFTARGAELLKRLGIRCIWIPIVSVVAASVIAALLGAAHCADAGNLPGLITGLTLILVSLIFRYGAELETQRPQLAGGDAEEEA